MGEDERIEIRAGLPASIIEMSRCVTVATSKWNKQGKRTDILGSLLSRNTNDDVQSVLAHENGDGEEDDDQSDAASWVDELHKAGYTDKTSLTWLASDLMGEEGPTFEAITFDISKKTLRPDILDQYQDEAYSDDDDSDLDSSSVSDSDSDDSKGGRTITSSAASFASGENNGVGTFLSVTAEDDVDTVFEVLSFDVVQSKSAKEFGIDGSSVKSASASSTDDKKSVSEAGRDEDPDDGSKISHED